jgi:hypothetical protein
MTNTNQKQLDITLWIIAMYLDLINIENTCAAFKTHQQEIDA